MNNITIQVLYPRQNGVLISNGEQTQKFNDDAASLIRQWLATDSPELEKFIKAIFKPKKVAA